MKQFIQLPILFFIFFGFSSYSSIQENGPVNKKFSIKLWDTAIIKNINYQLSLKENKSENSFFQKILYNEKQRLQVKTDNNGLRESFFYEVLNKPNFLNKFSHFYILEYYKGGEYFEAYISIFIPQTNKKYTYKLIIGNWKLITTETLLFKDVAKLFSNENDYLSDKCYSDESIFFTHFIDKKLSAKVFLFSCSESFKKIKKRLRLND